MPALSRDQQNSIRAKLLEQNIEISPSSVAKIVREVLPVTSKDELLTQVTQVLADTSGLGPLNELIQLPNITDVLVNSFDQVWFDRGNGLETSSIKWANESELREFASRLATSANQRLDDVNPFVDAQLSNGIRFHAIIPPLSRNGTTISLRIPATKTFSLDDLEKFGTFEPNVTAILKQLIAKRVSFAVSGSTGSGKTTILGAMLSEVNKGERVVVIEDSAELKLNHPHVVNLQARNPNSEGIGGVELKYLVKQALRMRPDRIVIGEVRGTEVLDLLIALNTGHEGGCVTIHANNSASVVHRFEALGLLAKINKSAVHALLSDAIKVVIHVDRTQIGRRITEISLLERRNDGIVHVEKALDLVKNLTFQPGWNNLQKLLQR